MGAFATHSHEIILVYNGNSSIGKQTYAYVSATHKAVHSIDVSKTKITGMQWVDIAEKLNLNIIDLIEKKHPEFIKNYGDKQVDLNANDAIKILQNHPETFIHPVVINGDRSMRITTPSDFVTWLK